MTSYFDVSDAEGLDLGDNDDAQDERAEALAWFASLEAAGPWDDDDDEDTDPEWNAADGGYRCDHCGRPEQFCVLCPECEEGACTTCGRVECCCHEGGEENDDMTTREQMEGGIYPENKLSAITPLPGFAAPLSEYTPLQLVSMRNAIDVFLRSQLEENEREAKALKAALGRPGRTGRRTRSDAGSKRPPVRDEKGVAV